jgi:hypothetical protein
MRVLSVAAEIIALFNFDPQHGTPAPVAMKELQIYALGMKTAMEEEINRRQQEFE